MVLSIAIQLTLLMCTLYLLYTRIIKMYLTVFKYTRRGVIMADGAYPCLGNTLQMQSELDKQIGYKDGPIPFLFTDVKKKGEAKFYGAYLFDMFLLMTKDPKVVEELFMEKNRYYEKH